MSDTPRTDELCRDHYYEGSAMEAGMCVSAKSPEECYREAIVHARQLERELAEAKEISARLRSSLDQAEIDGRETYRPEVGSIAKRANMEQAISQYLGGDFDEVPHLAGEAAAAIVRFVLGETPDITVPESTDMNKEP